MNRQRLEALTDAWRESSLTEAQAAELNQTLRVSEEARRFFRAEAELHGLLHCAVMAATVAETSAQFSPQVTAGRNAASSWSGWFRWRPLTAAAAGVVLGVFCTSVVLAYTSPKFAEAKALVRRLLSESFESGVTETLPGLPQAAGGWSGDEARAVTAEQGMKPKQGAKMLRFVSATFAGENARRSAWGDVYRLVDLRGQVGDAKSVVRLSASFDAGQFAAGEEYSCSVELCALELDLTGAPQPLTLPWVRENSAATGLRKIPMKGDGVWQESVVEVPVSPQTRYLLVHLAVLRTKPFPPAEPVLFSGHYLDDVKLELLSRPSPP